MEAMWGIAFVTALLLALPPVHGPAWRGVVNDWLDDNRFEQPHACAPVVVAWGRLETMSMPSGWSRIFDDLKREARRVCWTGDARRIRVGMSDAAVVAVAGKPRLSLSGPVCWVYPARRVCFANGHVVTVQSVVHG